MKAYITLLSSEDYLSAVLVLNKSIQRVCEYPLICAITEPVAQNKKILEILKQEQIKYEIIPEIHYSKEAIANIMLPDKGCEPRLINTASKIALFSLTQYEKLVYIDADSYIIYNIDKLFDFPDGSMLWTGKESLTGLMVFTPKNHCYKFYKDFLQCTDASDGQFFADLWFHIKSNSDYQIPITYLCHTSDNKEYPNIILFHKGFTLNNIKFFKMSNEELSNENLDLQYLYGLDLIPLRKKYCLNTL